MFIASISFSMSRARLIFASRRRLIRLWQQESKRTSSSEVPCSLKAEKVVCASGSDTSASGRSCNPMRRSGTSANRGRSVFSFETSRADSGPRSPLTVRATLREPSPLPSPSLPNQVSQRLSALLALTSVHVRIHLFVATVCAWSALCIQIGRDIVHLPTRVTTNDMPADAVAVRRRAISKHAQKEGRIYAPLH
ncbi:hypothetical protein QFZ99_005754 [Paraburkholderia atlantica]